MNLGAVIALGLHYHIRWLPSGKLDYERHDTRAQAEEAANQLAQPNEGHAIERFDEACSKCKGTVALRPS